MANNIIVLDVAALNTHAQAAIQAMFWGTVALAVVVPVAGAVGSKIAGKVTGSKKDTRYD